MDMGTARMMPLIDLHTHILPGIDDGARDVEEAADMLGSLRRQQVDTVVLTPHYPSDEIPLGEFLTRRQQAFERLRFREEAKAVKLVLASETFLSKTLFQHTDISPLCIGDRYLLVELPYATRFTPYVCEKLLKVTYCYGVYPILAHIERYPDLMGHPKVLEKLIDEGALMQINVSSLQSFRMRRRLFSLIKKGYVQLLGTDCHHLRERSPQYRVWTDKLQEELGKHTLAQLMQNARDVVDGVRLSG